MIWKQYNLLIYHGSVVKVLACMSVYTYTYRYKDALYLYIIILLFMIKYIDANLLAPSMLGVHNN